VRLKLLKSGLLLWLFPLATFAGVLDHPLPPEGLELQYDIYLKNDQVGQHRIEIHNQNGLTLIDHRRQIKVTVLGVTAYSQDHHSVETWKQLDLQRLEGTTTEDGKKLQVHGQLSAGKFEVEGTACKQSLDTHVATTNSFWVDRAVLRGLLVDNEDGQVFKASTQAMGSEVVDGRQAEKFSLRMGDRKGVSWYSDDLLVCGTLEVRGHVLEYRMHPSSN
jgi:hypothetical protein